MPCSKLLFAKAKFISFMVQVKATISDMVTKLIVRYREVSLYCKTRGNFIASDLWNTLSIISVLYVAVSVVISPFILWGKLPVEILLYMNIIWGTLLIIIYGFFFIELLFCSLSSKGRKWFDRHYHYKENGLMKKLEAIEHKLDDVISGQNKARAALDSTKSRVGKIEKEIHTQQPKKRDMNK